ncbi:MAG: CRTAC1 family protein [Planctomycetes bacterium]|nr:CRTAC1 family protein [Planctomycetota bacterium]
MKLANGWCTAALLASASPGQESSPIAAPQDANAQKRDALALIGEKLAVSTAPFYGKGILAELRAKLAALPADAIQKQCILRVQLGDALLGFGEIEAAIAEYERGVAAAEKSGAPRAVAASRRKLAMGWLRRGEVDNCIARHNRDSCLFPLRGGALHVERTGSTKAIEQLLLSLQADPEQLASVWLLNVAHMTLGSWPDGVPEPFRIPARAIASEHAMARMFDLAPDLGVNVSTRAGGSAMEDFDGDGDLELLCSAIGYDQPVSLFERQADGAWLDTAPQRGLDFQVGALNLLPFDADNDGRLDLIFQRGGWGGESGRVPNSLAMQQPDGRFVDRTREAGVEFAAPSQVAVANDIDLDGDLDLFLGYENVTPDVRFPCRLLRNDGHGRFEQIQRAAGVENGLCTKGAAFGDYDNDGLPDLYVSNLGGPNRLYRNLGDGRFVDVAAKLGVTEPRDSFSCFFLDYDNDGWLDLYVGCYDSGDRSAQLAAWYRDGKVPAQTQRLYRNDGKGGFTDVTVAAGLARPSFPMGSNFGDLDNDGFLDLYLATGDPDLSSLWPNVMFRNDGGRRFQDVTDATGTGHLQKGHGVSFGDLDGDGDQDLFVRLGGAALSDGFAAALYENPTAGKRWLTVRLVGRESNRFGVGARLKATIEEGGATRDVHHLAGGNSSFGGNSLQAELGLGSATRLVALEVKWPRTGKVQRFTELPLDRIVVVDEGASAPTVLPPATVQPLAAER